MDKCTLVDSKKFKSIEINLDMLLPFTKENASYLTILSYLLTASTRKYPSRKLLNETVERMNGSKINMRHLQKGSLSNLHFSFQVPNFEYFAHGSLTLGDTLEFMRQVIFFPNINEGLFPEETFRIEKQNLIQELKNNYNNKRFLAADSARKLYYMNDRNQQVNGLGDIEFIESIDNQMLANFYFEHIEKNAIQVSAVGEIDTAEFANEVAKKFKNIKSWGDFATSDFIVEQQIFDSPQVKHIEQDIEQVILTKIYNFKPIKSLRDLAIISLLNDILGGSALSLLFQNIREKLSLAYYINSNVAINRSTMIIQGGFNPDKTAVADDKIAEQITLIQEGNFNGHLLINAKNTLVNNYRQQSDYSRGVLSRKIDSQINDYHFKNEKELKEVLDGITVDDIANKAKTLSEEVSVTVGRNI